MNDRALKLSGILMGLFGIISLFISASVLLNVFGMREREGNNAFFIVYINFFSSFVYLFSSYGFFTKKEWTTKILFITVAILLGSYVGLIFYIQSGKTIGLLIIKVMLVRVSLTMVFAGISWYLISRIKLVELKFPGE